MTIDNAAGPRVKEHDVRECDGSLVKAFTLLGKRWNGVILSTLQDGPATFSELRRAVGGISDSVLSERTTELTAAGLIERTVSAGPPVAVSYALTPAGKGLVPTLRELKSWASANLN